MTIEEEANAFARAFLTRAIEAYHNDLKAATGDDATVPHTLIVQAGNRLIAGQMEDGFVEPMTTRNGVELARRTAGKVGWAIVFFEAWFAPSDSEITGPVADRPDRMTSLVVLLEVAGGTEQRAYTAKLPDLEIEEMPASSEDRLFNFSGLLRPVAEG